MYYLQPNNIFFKKTPLLSPKRKQVTQMYNLKAIKIEIKIFIFEHVIGLHHIPNQNKNADVLID